MSGTSRRCKQFEAMSAPVIALLLDRRLLDSWPFEISARARATLRSAPDVNVWRRALEGDDSGVIVNNVVTQPEGDT